MEKSSLITIGAGAAVLVAVALAFLAQPAAGFGWTGGFFGHGMTTNSSHSLNQTFNSSRLIASQQAAGECQLTLDWSLLNAVGNADPSVAGNLSGIIGTLYADNASLSQFGPNTPLANFTGFQRMVVGPALFNATRDLGKSLMQVRLDSKDNASGVNVTMLRQELFGLETQAGSCKPQAFGYPSSNSGIHGQASPMMGRMMPRNWMSSMPSMFSNKGFHGQRNQ